MHETTILRLNCPDKVGLLARLTGFISTLGGNLLEVHQFTDPAAKWFFTRMEIDSSTLKGGAAALRRSFEPLGGELDAEWTIRDAASPMRMVVLVSRFDHCLTDLLYRWRSGELPAAIPLVLSNHTDLQPLVEREGIPFRCIPVADVADGKAAAFAEITEACAEAKAELLVLARYMQIVPDALCRQYHGRLINIHHSFLPAFVGANPYRRAHERGVKLIGATCHYATPELDEGPIIDQEVVRVEHYHTPDDLLRLGRDCERMALARGVRYHVTDRVLLHGKRTIVFRD